MASKRKGSRQIAIDPVVKETAAILEELEDYEEQFTDWEKGFYANICDRFYESALPLTSPQLDSLKKMQSRLCRNSSTLKKDRKSYNL